MRRVCTGTAAVEKAAILAVAWEARFRDTMNPRQAPVLSSCAAFRASLPVGEIAKAAQKSRCQES